MIGHVASAFYPGAAEIVNPLFTLKIAPAETASHYERRQKPKLPSTELVKKIVPVDFLL
jgi:hypothetical protein